jgi:hypothetical protein
MEVGCRFYVRETSRALGEIGEIAGKSTDIWGCLQVQGMLGDLRDRQRNWSEKHVEIRQGNTTEVSPAL